MKLLYRLSKIFVIATFCIATLQAGQVDAIQQPATPVATAPQVVAKKENTVALALLKSMQAAIEEEQPESSWKAMAREALRLVAALGLAGGVGYAVDSELYAYYHRKIAAAKQAGQSTALLCKKSGCKSITSFLCALTAIAPCLYFIKKCFYKQKNEQLASRTLTNFISSWESYKSECPEQLSQKLMPLIKKFARDKTLGLTEKESRRILSEIVLLYNEGNGTKKLINDLSKSIIAHSQINNKSSIGDKIEMATVLSVPTSLLLLSLTESVAPQTIINNFAGFLVMASGWATFMYIPLSISDEIRSRSGDEIALCSSFALASIIENWEQYKTKLSAEDIKSFEPVVQYYEKNKELNLTESKARELLNKIINAYKA